MLVKALVPRECAPHAAEEEAAPPPRGAGRDAEDAESASAADPPRWGRTSPRRRRNVFSSRRVVVFVFAAGYAVSPGVDPDVRDELGEGGGFHRLHDGAGEVGGVAIASAAREAERGDARDVHARPAVADGPRERPRAPSRRRAVDGGARGVRRATRSRRQATRRWNNVAGAWQAKSHPRDARGRAGALLREAEDVRRERRADDLGRRREHERGQARGDVTGGPASDAIAATAARRRRRR